MKWAKTLKFSNKLAIEERVARIVEYIVNYDALSECFLSGLDATGQLGNRLTKELNKIKDRGCSLIDILKVLREEGQVFEMYLQILSKVGTFEISIKNGSLVDILGNGNAIPNSILGDFEELDVNLFNPPTS